MSPRLQNDLAGPDILAADGNILAKRNSFVNKNLLPIARQPGALHHDHGVGAWRHGRQNVCNRSQTHFCILSDALRSVNFQSENL
jgi:hypothetical protein